MVETHGVRGKNGKGRGRRKEDRAGEERMGRREIMEDEKRDEKGAQEAI